MTFLNLRAHHQLKKVSQVVVSVLTLSITLITLQVVPAQANPTFTVTFHKNTAGGTAPASITVNQGSSVTLPGGTGMTNSDSFAGWSAVSGLSGRGSIVGVSSSANVSYSAAFYSVGFSSFTPVADITLYATWQPLKTILFQAGGATGTEPSQPDVPGGTSLVMPSAASLTKAGSCFDGWKQTYPSNSSTYNQIFAVGDVFNNIANNVFFTAQWLTGNCSVSYNGNGSTGGSLPSAVTIANGGTYTVAANPGTLVKTGSVFQGWSSTLNGSLVTSKVITGRTVFYASWLAVPTYAITLNSNGGSGLQTASSWVQGASATTLPVTSTFTRTGHSFAGWAATAASTTPVLTYATEAPVTFYAIWTRNSYSVTFNKNSDTATGTMAIETRSASTELPLNTFTWDVNHTFLGWNTAANGSGTNYSDGQSYPYVASTTLYARWGNTINYSSVGADSGSPTRSSDSWTSGAISLPTVGTMVKPGHTFGGWSNGSSTFTTTYTPTTGITLNPVWTPNTYTVSFQSRFATGSVPANQTWVYSATPLTLPGNTGSLTLAGYEFAGWGSYPRSTTPVATFSSTSNIYLTQTYFAIWRKVPYTVTYSLNGGTGSAPTQADVYIFDRFTVANAPTRASYVFGGWSDSYTIYSAGSAYTVESANIVLTAQWIPLFTVSYLFNGSLDTPTANSTVAGGTSVTLAAAPTRTGYNFAGWLGNSETTTRTAGSSFTVVEDSTLRAAWTPINYTVTYALNSGTSTLPTEGAKNLGDEFVVATTPSRAGYLFTGWSDGINTFGAEASYIVGTAPITLTAQWSAINYTVTYDLGGGVGTLPTKSDVIIGDTFTVSTVTDPTWLAHTFLGWSDGGSLYAKTASYAVGDRNITLTATWVQNGYTQISYARGAGASGTLPTQVSLLEGNYFTVASGSTLANTTNAFVGWSDGTDTITAGSSYYVGADPITLTALWDTGYGATYLAGTGTGTAPVDALYRLTGATFTLSGAGALTKSGYTFAGWNDGTSSYLAGATYTVASAHVTFTAQWNVVAASVVQAPLFIPIKEEKKEEKKEPAKVVVTPKTTAAESPLVAKASTATTDTAAIDRLFTPTATQPTPAQSAAGAKLVAIENVRVIDSVTAVNNIALTTTSSTPAVVTISLKEPVISDQVTESLRKKATVVATTAGFTVTPVDGFTGILVVPIIATIEGVQTVVYNKVVVSPEAPAPQSFAPVTIGRSAIAWSSTPSQVVSYEVAVNNKVVCTTTTTTCSVPSLIGPNSKVTLVAIGNDATVSTAQVVPYVAKAPIPALKVNFATGSAVLTAAQKAEIAAIAKVIKGEGFTRLVVNGFTDSRGSVTLNAALSKARASAVVAYMQTLLPSVAVKAGAKGSANPVASNANANGQAANRRTEIATW